MSISILFNGYSIYCHLNLEREHYRSPVLDHTLLLPLYIQLSVFIFLPFSSASFLYGGYYNCSFHCSYCYKPITRGVQKGTGTKIWTRHVQTSGLWFGPQSTKTMDFGFLVLFVQNPEVSVSNRKVEIHDFFKNTNCIAARPNLKLNY